MQDCISVINCGSSSIKFSLYGVGKGGIPELVFRGKVDGITIAPKFTVWDPAGEIVAEQQWESGGHEYLLEHTIAWIKERRTRLGLRLCGVGHRVVHGGEIYNRPVIIDTKVLQQLEEFIPLAPLHQTYNLDSIKAVMKMSGDVPQVACFDTAFHRTTPPIAEKFAIPRWLSEGGVKRYGFHGLSYNYISRRLKEHNPEEAGKRVIVAHLGSGASMCALRDGKSVASSMGFTALDGLVMGTRPGNVDPGVILYLMQEKGFGAEELTQLLYKKSGLLGISGISSDMRVLLESKNPRAEEAVAVFLYRIQREIGSLAAVLGGVDSFVFTGGIGENSPVIRRRICERAAWLGVQMDMEANQAGELRIETKDSSVALWIIPTNEEFMIAHHTLRLLDGAVELSRRR